MKEKLFAILIAFLLTITGIAIVNADKPEEKIGANEIDPNGFHYTLNILGKKADWKGGGEYNNPDRSTIFVPQYTDGFSYDIPYDDPVTTGDDIAIWFSEGPEFAVTDGNAFDDGMCSIELPETQKFSVWICSRAKPGYDTEIEGMVYAEDNVGGWYLYKIGTFQVKRKWTEAKDLFWVDPGEDFFGIITGSMWIFDYLEFIKNYDFGDDPDITEAMYFWDFDNNGNKLVKVRFYPI